MCQYLGELVLRLRDLRSRHGRDVHRAGCRPDVANWLNFLERLGGWVLAEVGRVYAILDNPSTHRASRARHWALAHPRWEFVFQLTYAGYLNLIEPWWKVLRSLALTSFA